ncbi:nodulation protein NfeD [Cytobacillus sp. S13-E01]|uniref:NfeD family protein n=1 Tax=Cytobacillus sp. S13-E01 TaxID=3031326 RepID=UPI0023D88625|nr:nodulation protein NfeD [Cytobacillus sp. S13-E01]MDF0727221.1 nodulation protein NfeD [Cytobacillus sp. S13-E01]
MKRFRLTLYISLLILSLALTILPDNSHSSSDSNDIVYVIPVESTVEKGLSSFLDRSITEAEDANADVIILDIYTPGGAVDAAGDIGKRINATKIPVVAFVNNQALSAGAYIALNADAIYMTPDSTMGSAAIIDQQGNTAGKKAESFWFAAMKTAAEQNGRDPIFALAMADADIDLPEYGAGKGDLLTLTASQAVEVKYSEGTVANLDALLSKLGYKDAIVEKMEVAFAEKLARFITNPIVVPILLSIGSLGLVLELYSPGFGIPGIMGVSSLLLFFYGHMVAGLAGMESLILFVVGVVLILLEFFIPGGIIGLIGFGAILTSLFIATDNVTYMALSLLIAIGVTIMASIILFKVFGKRINIFRKIILSDSTNTEKGYVSNVNRIELVGNEGFALTSLRPSGTALINDERLDVVTEGNYIQQNSKVVVVKTEGSRIVVREIKNSEAMK